MMQFIRLISLSVALVLAASCRPSPAPVTPDGAAGMGQTPCGKAAARITALKCSVTTPKTGIWAAACVNAQANGIDMHVACVSSASSCPVVKKCLGEP